MTTVSKQMGCCLVLKVFERIIIVIHLTASSCLFTSVFQILSMLVGDSYLSDEEERPPKDNDLEEDTETLLTHKSVCDSGLSISLTSQSGVCVCVCAVSYTHLRAHET